MKAFPPRCVAFAVVLIGTVSPLPAVEAASPAAADVSSVPPAFAERPPSRVMAFDATRVRLLDGPFREAQERDRRYLLSVDPDRLLLMFRVTAGQSSRAKPLGGWEAPGVELRGHTLIPFHRLHHERYTVYWKLEPAAAGAP